MVKPVGTESPSEFSTACHQQENVPAAIPRVIGVCRHTEQSYGVVKVVRYDGSYTYRQLREPLIRQLREPLTDSSGRSVASSQVGWRQYWYDDEHRLG